MQLVNLRRFAAVVGVSVGVAALSADVCNGSTIAVPNAFESTAGNTSFAGPLSRFARTFQLLVDDTQLTSIAGQQITGVTWRQPASATTNWPAADVNYASFDIYLSNSVEPSARSATMADNIVGTQTQVRAGALTIPASSFVGSAASPEPFGFVITFDTPYAYAGGNLLLEMRQSTHDGTDRSVDAVSPATAGYGTAFSAQWGSTASATTGTQANAIITQFVAVVPEPASIALAAPAAFALCIRRRRAGTRVTSSV